MAGASGTYVYDGDGKRSTKTVGTTATNYVYDVSGKQPTVLDDGTRKYVWGAGGLAYTVDKTTAAVQVYHTDGLGSVRAVTDSTGNVVQTYQTDEFGIPVLSQGTSAQPFGFTGEQRDLEDGLVYLRARMYDPNLGRFIQRDVVSTKGAGIVRWNRFSYVGNGPVSHTDPTGNDYSCRAGVGGRYAGGGRVAAIAVQNCSGDILTQTVWVDLWGCARVVDGECMGATPVDRLGRCDRVGPGELVCPVQAPSPLVGLLSGRLSSGIYLVKATNKWVDFTSIQSILSGAYDTSTSGAIYVPENDEEPTGPFDVYNSPLISKASPGLQAKSLVLRP